MSDSPAQIVCTIANDFRLIVAGAAAVSAHAARRAGLAREAQEEVADAAVEVCAKAFSSKVTPKLASPPLRIDFSDRSDRVEVTLAVDMQAHPVTSPVNTSLAHPLAEQIRWEAGEEYFHVTVLRLCGTQSLKPAAGDSSSHC